MFRFIDDKGRMVVLDSFFALDFEWCCGDDWYEECLDLGKEKLAGVGNIIHVGKRKEEVDTGKDNIFFARFNSIIIVDKNKINQVGYPAGSDLVIMWFDSDLNNLPEKIQKYLSQVSWDEHATNIYS